MSFHPDQSLPGCMMPDGGDCCAGHAAVVEDWHKQRAQIAKLTKQLEKAHAVLEQCQQCIRGDTPEDMTDEEAREDTISKIREIILSDDLHGEQK